MRLKIEETVIIMLRITMLKTRIAAKVIMMVEKSLTLNKKGPKLLNDKGLLVLDATSESVSTTSWASSCCSLLLRSLPPWWEQELVKQTGACCTTV